MKVELDEATIDRIATAVVKKMKGQSENEEGEYVTTMEAARILSISTNRLRHVKHLFPHKTVGEGDKSELMFLRKGLWK